MTHDGLTQRLLDAMARHPGERRTAREWTGALPPLTPTGHVLHRLTRLANEGRVQQYPTHCPVDARDKRAKHKHRTHEYRIPHCPMIDAGIDQLDVMKFWADKGWQWPLVSNCAHCFYHDDSEL